MHRLYGAKRRVEDTENRSPNGLPLPRQGQSPLVPRELYGALPVRRGGGRRRRLKPGEGVPRSESFKVEVAGVLNHCPTGENRL